MEGPQALNKHNRHVEGAVHKKPLGMRDHQARPINTGGLDPKVTGSTVRELKAEQTGNNRTYASTMVIIVIGALAAYSIFYRG